MLCDIEACINAPEGRDLGALSAPCGGLSAGGKLQMRWGGSAWHFNIVPDAVKGLLSEREETVDLLWDLDLPTYRIWSPGEKRWLCFTGTVRTVALCLWLPEIGTVWSQ